MIAKDRGGVKNTACNLSGSGLGGAAAMAGAGGFDAGFSGMGAAAVCGGNATAGEGAGMGLAAWTV